MVAKISVGMPVYNGEMSIRRALDSLLVQSFSDFELIISDNGSSDGTERICREYAERDQRIRYIRQPTNIGAGLNFKFVLDEARSEYFMWAACDDVRSPDFLEFNQKFLSEHSEYVASTSPNGFDNRSLDQQKLVNFALDGDVFNRYMRFFEFCWSSHGIFYSLVRTDVIRGCKIVGQTFTGADWAIDLYLASMGRMNRTKEGHALFGVHGISSSANAYKAMRKGGIEFIFPFFYLTAYVLKLVDSFSLSQKLVIISILIKLNFEADVGRINTWLYVKYCRFIRPLVRHK